MKKEWYKESDFNESYDDLANISEPLGPDKEKKEQLVAKKHEVPIENKVALTIQEAAAYSNIGQNKINKLLKTPNCPFALYVGTKKLVKRKAFEEFINKNIEI